MLETLRFLTPEGARDLREAFGTPLYVYDLCTLRQQAKAALAFPQAYGLTVRFAMKAASNAALLQYLSGMGLHFDASSGYEVSRALMAGVPARRISLSSQEMPSDFAVLFEQGIRFNACSLNQLARFGKRFPSGRCGIRFNPGLGSGGTGKTNVGGPHSSFGIWHEQLPEVRRIVDAHNLVIERIHTHIGSGSDPAIWAKVSELSLGLVRHFPSVTTLNLGGGFKVGRMADESSTDLATIGFPVQRAFEALAEETGQKLHLEIEPGTFLVANACSLLCTAQDIVATGGPEGMDFIKLDAGMTEILRPSLYAAQHPIIVIPEVPTHEESPYLVVGHCCESGDSLTLGPQNPETLQPRRLARAKLGDLVVLEGVGAYCSSMSAKNYNSFPEAAEVLIDEEHKPHLIRQRQTLEQIIQNEIPCPIYPLSSPQG